MDSIVTLTMNPAIDTSCAVDLVLADHKLRCTAPRHDAGGGGINVSRAIRRLGGDSLALYLAGGPTGQLLHQLLDREEVRQQQLPMAAWTREDLYVLEDSTRHQYRFIMPGAEVTEEEWQRCLDAIAHLPEKPKYLVVSGSLPPGVPKDFYARVATLAKEAGIRMVLDTAGEPLRLALQVGVYMVKVNLREMSELAGSELEDEPKQAAAAQKLVQYKQAEVVVLSLGPGGAVLATPAGSERIYAPSIRIKSRVGAGDSMTAGIVWGLAKGMLVRPAVRLGIAAGAAAMLNPGTQLCLRTDVERLSEQVH